MLTNRLTYKNVLMGNFILVSYSGIDLIWIEIGKSTTISKIPAKTRRARVCLPQTFPSTMEAPQAHSKFACTYGLCEIALNYQN